MEAILQKVQEELSKVHIGVGVPVRSVWDRTHRNRGEENNGHQALRPPRSAGSSPPSHPSAGSPDTAVPGTASPPHHKSKPLQIRYFGHSRPEVVALVPTARVLDIGCGAGRLGEAIKQRQQAWVSGIEFDAGAAAAARHRLDQVWQGDIERLDLEIPAGSFDAIVCADVLEHLVEPRRLLERARRWLAPEGRLVASLPNVRHHSVVSSLLEGNWSLRARGPAGRDAPPFLHPKRHDRPV